MASSNTAYSSAISAPSSPSKADRAEDYRCAVCQQTNCDIQIVSCGCLLHTTCLPLDILFVKQQMRTNSYANQQTFCPCCRRTPILQIRVLPLPMAVLEEAARLRDKDNEILSINKSEVSSLACGSPANSIALFNGTNKRPFAAKSAICRSYRTGRWASEESAFTDKLIKAFDAGLLPLPHGIKLNDFLCDLLSCRTSRLTKKLKNAKLSARTYRSWASGNTMGSFSNTYVGGDIQRSQTLFLKTITPEWVRMELQFNISRMWRTHLANFCLQISYLQLDTKEWFASLDAVDCIAISCNETKLQARKKRMRSALTEDANAAARTVLPVTKDMSNNDNETLSEVTCSTNSDKEGVFVGGLPFKRLSDLNLKGMADADKAAGSSVEGHSEEAVAERRDRLDSLSSIFSSGNVTSMRKFSFDASVLESSMKPSTSMSSFVELFTPDLRPMKPPSRRTSDIDAQPIDLGGVAKNDEIEIPAARDRAESVVDSIIDEAIDSVLESSTAERDFQGLFLKEISKFLIEADSPFQHVDLWVPMDVSHSDLVGEKHIGGSSTMATTSSNRVTGIIYGGQQASSVRLSHAGYITVGSTPQVVNSLNEFGMYSKNFSFSPGFGLPGRVYLSRTPSWENNLRFLEPEQFARVGGAKIYGVNTTLAIPVFTPIGTMVVALYSTENLNRDVAWEKRCMQHFWKLKPEPKWKLTIDVGLKTGPEDVQDMSVPKARDSSPSITSVNNQAFVIPPSPTNSNKPSISSQQELSLEDKKLGATPSVTPYSWNEQSLALLIGKYMPLDRDASQNQSAANPSMSNADFAGNLMSLRLLLLRHSSCRTNNESKMVDIIMGKYRSYCSASMKEHDVILSIVNEWKQLVALTSSVSKGQSNATSFNARQSVTPHNSCSSNNSIPSMPSMSNNSPMTSPTPSSFLSGAGAPAASLKPMIPSMNQFGDNFSLPLVTYGNSLQNMPNSNISSSMPGHEGTRFQTGGQNNVPRVVSEQGPIETNEMEKN